MKLIKGSSALLIILLLTFIFGCSQKDSGWKEIPLDTFGEVDQSADQASQPELGYSKAENLTGGGFMPKQVHAEHILVKTSQEANSILFDLNKGGNFEDIARARSICPSSKKGGDLGWFGRGQMVKEFEDAAFATPPGQISGIVKTQFGYHIIKVLEAK